MNDSYFLCIVDKYVFYSYFYCSFAKILVLSIDNPSFVVSIHLDDLPVSITKDVEKICIFTRSIQTFEFISKNWTVQEMNIPVMKLLKEKDCIDRIVY